MNGPKKGIMLVTPTITAIRAGYGNLKMLQQIRQRIPIIRESRSFPLINPLMIL